MKVFLLFIVFLVVANIHAQLSHTFSQTARNIHYGYVECVAVDSNGTVFTAGTNGLRAYSYIDSTFHNIAYLLDGFEDFDVNDITVGPNVTIFLANGDDGLSAYSYNGTSFTNTANIYDGGSASGIAVATDGTVFLANSDDGLRAYTYDGSSFTNTAHIDDGGSASGVVVAADGTVFLANGSDGLRAYSFFGYLNKTNKMSKMPYKFEILMNNPKTETINFGVKK